MSLSKCYSSLLDSMNAEIRIRWLQIVVRNDYYPDLHRVRRFLESQVQPCVGPAPPPSLPSSLSQPRLGIPENRVGKMRGLGWHWGRTLGGECPNPASPQGSCVWGGQAPSVPPSSNSLGTVPPQKTCSGQREAKGVRAGSWQAGHKRSS